MPWKRGVLPDATPLSIISPVSPLPLWCDIPLFPLMVACLFGYGLEMLRWLNRGWFLSLGIPRWDGGITTLPGLKVGASLPLLAGYGLGFGVVAMLILLLGALHLLYLPVMWLVLGSGLLLFWRNRRAVAWSELPGLLKPVDKSEWLIVGVLTCILSFHLLGCFLPTFGQDELTYHLTIPRQYLIAHQIHATPNLLHGNFPYNAEMIYLLCLGLGSEMLCKLVQWSMLVILLLAVLVWSRRLDREAGYLSLLLYLVAVGGVYVRSPMEAGTDVPVTLFLALGFFFLVNASCSNWLPSVFLAGVFNGLAWGSKLVAPAFVTPLLLVYMIWKGLYFRREAQGMIWKSLVLSGLLTSVLFAPWMVKNALCTGNPLYPMLGRLFPSPPPYDAIQQRLFEYEHKANFYYHQSEDEMAGPGATSTSTSLEDGHFSLMRVFHGYKAKLVWSCYEGDYLLLLFLATSITGIFLSIPEWRGHAITGLVANVIFFFIYGAHINRFFSVTYPLAAVLSGIQLGAVFRQTSFSQLLKGVVTLALALTMLNFQSRWCDLVNWHGRPCLTRAGFEQFLERYNTHPEQKQVWEALPELVPEDGYILGHGVRYPFFIPRRIYCICDYEEELLSQLLRQYGSWEPVLGALKQMGFTHLILEGTSSVAPGGPASPSEVGLPVIPLQVKVGDPSHGWPPRDWLDAHTELLIRVEGLELRKLLD